MPGMTTHSFARTTITNALIDNTCAQHAIREACAEALTCICLVGLTLLRLRMRSMHSCATRWKRSKHLFSRPFVWLASDANLLSAAVGPASGRRAAAAADVRAHAS